jgi:hypothetical protein
MIDTENDLRQVKKLIGKSKKIIAQTYIIESPSPPYDEMDMDICHIPKPKPRKNRCAMMTKKSKELKKLENSPIPRNKPDYIKPKPRKEPLRVVYKDKKIRVRKKGGGFISPAPTTQICEKINGGFVFRVVSRPEYFPEYFPIPPKDQNKIIEESVSVKDSIFIILGCLLCPFVICGLFEIAKHIIHHVK